MKLAVNRIYGGVIFKGTQEYVIKQMTFDVSATGITDIQEVDEIIRQLQQLKSEIADGCTKAVIEPITSLDQIEADNRNLDK